MITYKLNVKHITFIIKSVLLNSKVGKISVKINKGEEEQKKYKAEKPQFKPYPFNILHIFLVIFLMDI